MPKGKFVISLDFELMWGVRDTKTKATYGKNIEGVHLVIPKLLSTFSKYGIKGTFSTVGLLFFETREELLANIPAEVPSYRNGHLSPYNGYLDELGEDYHNDLYHFAPALIREIQKHPGNEISTHTFSHYYCLEKGQTVDQFRADIECAIAVAKKYAITLSSLIFPRNQFNQDYLQVIAELGLICYRGNEHSWLYQAKSVENESTVRRALRLMDAYVNLSGHNCYEEKKLRGELPVDIPSSRFLRPYSPKLSFLDDMRLKRIKSGMTHAARHNLVYHLWWHPHNFGIHQEKNFSFLEKILAHYKSLNAQYGFESCTMSNLAKSISNG